MSLGIMRKDFVTQDWHFPRKTETNITILWENNGKPVDLTAYICYTGLYAIDGTTKFWERQCDAFGIDGKSRVTINPTDLTDDKIYGATRGVWRMWAIKDDDKSSELLGQGYWVID